MFADLLGDVRDRLAFGQLHDHRLEQEREPASRPRPRHRDRVHAVGGARHARHARVNERLVLEEVQMPPHALPRVMHRTRGLAAPRFRAGNREPAANPIAICSSRLPSSSSRNSTPDTLHGSGSCRAAVNNDVVSIPPNYPTSTTTPPDPLTHTKQRKAKRDNGISFSPRNPSQYAPCRRDGRQY